MANSKAPPKALTDKTCKQIIDLVIDYLNDNLAPALKRDFQHHLRLCPDCVNFLNTYSKTLAVSRRLRVDDIPAKMRSNILDFLRKRIDRPSSYCG